uniref:YfhO family protein n=1 Tax=mine drainage metagenome TaxID=410659 RepID=E6Q514_9ZZZZ
MRRVRFGGPALPPWWLIAWNTLPLHRGRTCVFGALVALLALLGTAWQLRGFGPNAIWYLQDWSWPPITAQLRELATVTAAPWTPIGVGRPAIEPFLSPVYLLTSLLPSLGLPSLICRTLVYAMALLTLDFAIVASALSLGTSRLTAIALGLIAQFGPVILNKVAAGHTYYLIALAALALSTAIVLQRNLSQSLRLVAAGCLCGIAIVQIQLYVVGLLAIAVAMLALRRASSSARIAAFVASLSLSLPFIIALHSAPVAKLLPPLRTTTPWIANNSAPLSLGIIQLGYSPGYVRSALIGIAAWLPLSAMWALVALALYGAFVARKRTIAKVLFAAWCLTTFIVLGVNGPLNLGIRYIFAHLLLASAFRELYHFAGVAWLCELLLVALALRTLPRRGATVIAATALFSIVAIWHSKDFNGVIAARTVPRSVIARMHAIRRAKGDWRFILVPAEWPIGPIGASYGGVDPLAYPVGLHPSANQYRLHGPAERAVAFARAGDLRRARAWFSAAGIGAIVPEPGLSMVDVDRFAPPRHIPHWLATRIGLIGGAMQGPSIVSTCVLCAYARLPRVGSPFEWRGGGAFLPTSSLMTPCHPLRGLPHPRAGDPSHRWVAADQWRWLDSRLSFLRPSALLTWSSAPLRLAGCKGALLRIAIVHGSVMIDGRSVHIKNGFGIIALPPGDHVLLPIHGLVAIESLRHTPQSQHFAAKGSSARLGFDWRKGEGTGWVGPQTHWVVLKTRYSSGWHIVLSRGRVLQHLMVSNFANGWRISLRHRARITVWYAPESTIKLFQRLGLALWAFVAFGTLILFIQHGAAQLRRTS